GPPPVCLGSLDAPPPPPPPPPTSNPYHLQAGAAWSPVPTYPLASSHHHPGAGSHPYKMMGVQKTPVGASYRPTLPPTAHNHHLLAHQLPQPNPSIRMPSIKSNGLSIPKTRGPTSPPGLGQSTSGTVGALYGPAKKRPPLLKSPVPAKQQPGLRVVKKSSMPS